MVSFFGIGLLFGNLSALAMQPLGAIAGTGSAVVGGMSMLISLTLGTGIGQIYNGTVLPLAGGLRGAEPVLDRRRLVGRGGRCWQADPCLPAAPTCIRYVGASPSVHA